MFYITKKCPYCGSSYQFTTSAENNKAIGNPFLRCSHCVKEFIDTDYFEVETLTDKELNKLLIDAVILDLCGKDSIGVIERIKYGGKAKEIVNTGGQIRSNAICESLIRTMNEEYCAQLESIKRPVSHIDKKRFYFPKYRMSLEEYISKHLNSEGKSSDDSINFKPGYYF